MTGTSITDTGRAEEASLELSPRGDRFVDADSESEFLAWQAVEAIPANRSALVAGAGVGVAQAIAFALLQPEGYAPWLGPIAALEVLAIAAIIATRRGPATRWMQPIVATFLALFGLLTVGLLSVHLAQSDIAFAAAVGFTFAAFAVFRIRPAQGAFAATGAVVPQLVLAARSFRAGGLAPAEMLLPAIMLPTLLVGGYVTALANDARLRQSFRYQRIIERQKETIARERERTESLLRKELGHQVAERSRQIGAALSREGAPLDARHLVAGERFDARYRIVAALGAGGMGAVYEVERVTDGQRLALKAVLGSLSSSMAARFAREAEIGARVHHPNLVSIVDVGVSSGVPFLVMEVLRGGSLEERRDRFGEPSWALPILRQIAEGLLALHGAGVVHRDLKPANVLVADGTDPIAVKISDFGISRLDALTDAVVDPDAATLGVGPPARSAALTGTGVVMGTPLYMAPEAARGERVDAPSDVFALGIMAYEMLTGSAPFEVPVALLAQARQPIPIPAPVDAVGVPAALRELIVACLLPDPRQRPSVATLLAHLAG